MLGTIGRNGMPFMLLNNFLQMRSLELMKGLKTRPIRRLLATAQLLFGIGLTTFLRAK
jgi:hypothetical protein